MAELSYEELKREHRAKVFNAYFGNLAGFLVPVAVLGLTLWVGDVQRRRDIAARNAEAELTRQREREQTRRECLSQMRDTLQLFATRPDEKYAGVTVSLATTFNDVCSRVGVSLPPTMLQAVQKAQADPEAPAAVRASAAQVIASQPLRVFMHIASEDQRGLARKAELRLEQVAVAQASVVVPGIELVAQAPRQTELRYFNAADEATAESLARTLEPLLDQPVQAKRLTVDNVPNRTFELWMAR